LRHAAASHCALVGLDLYSIKEILSHVDIPTTQRLRSSHAALLRVLRKQGDLIALEKEKMELGVNREYPLAGRGFGQPLDCMVRPVGIEPTTLSLEGSPEVNNINED